MKMESKKEKYFRILTNLKSELGGSEADLVDNLILAHREYCKEYNNYNIGVTHQEAFKALDDFLLDCEWITQDEREDIMERLVLVEEE